MKNLFALKFLTIVFLSISYFAIKKPIGSMGKECFQDQNVSINFSDVLKYDLVSEDVMMHYDSLITNKDIGIIYEMEVSRKKDTFFICSIIMEFLDYDCELILENVGGSFKEAADGLVMHYNCIENSKNN